MDERKILGLSDRMYDLLRDRQEIAERMHAVKANREAFERIELDELLPLHYYLDGKLEEVAKQRKAA